MSNCSFTCSYLVFEPRIPHITNWTEKRRATEQVWPNCNMQRTLRSRNEIASSALLHPQCRKTAGLIGIHPLNYDNVLNCLQLIKCSSIRKCIRTCTSSSAQWPITTQQITTITKPLSHWSLNNLKISSLNCLFVSGLFHPQGENKTIGTMRPMLAVTQ